MSRKNSSPKHKTNAVRMIESAGIRYELREYEAPDGFLDGISVAEALGQNPAQTFKTLVAAGGSRETYVCVIPVAEELDLKKAAKHFGEKKMEMLPSKQITETTGYIKGGCSPVGMKKQFKTAIHRTAADFDNIMVSAGKVGLQVELEPGDLARITGAEFADLTV
ncbi:MAG: Cys-tRNA(Pro) deacylase [Lentihominibacter sp.]|jgi:Cys-tRNA(Pro)/Cys-tRNA(Cys) deacylase